METFIIDSDHARKICGILFEEKHFHGITSEVFQDSKKELYRFTKKYQVMIIGGGYSGVRFKKIKKKIHTANGFDQTYFEPTIISKNEYFENISIIPNFIVHDKLEDYRSDYKKVKNIFNTKKSVSKKELTLFTEK
jgi:hypothetical protein